MRVILSDLESGSDEGSEIIQIPAQVPITNADATPTTTPTATPRVVGDASAVQLSMHLDSPRTARRVPSIDRCEEEQQHLNFLPVTVFGAQNSRDLLEPVDRGDKKSLPVGLPAGLRGSRPNVGYHARRLKGPVHQMSLDETGALHPNHSVGDFWSL